MKKFIIIVCSVVFCWSCSSNEVEYRTIRVSTIVDITDPHHLLPDADTVLSLYNYALDQTPAGYFRMRIISDKILTPVNEFVLADEATFDDKNLNGEPRAREFAILGFYDDVRRSISLLKNMTDTTLGNSECFRTIASELSYLNQYTGDERILLIYSDLRENSGILDLYNQGNIDTQAIYNAFVKEKALPDTLINVKVYFLFRPSTREEDIVYRKIAGVYDSLLTSKGAAVIIEAMNKF